ncbi:recQ-mediated genome instability protein 1-like [Asterias amurensis]|uniref:recQ-mediated genome instability protein 1-like n=1 Tax=Asterias amurensis TaxID=7602 RepID=UPI003AB5DC8D
MNLQVQEVTAFLKARHVPVIDEWTVECLDWLKQEYQGQNITSDEMKQNVYDQWLDSDLNEIAAPSLPQNISQQKKTLLSGNYALQINSLQDVSMPAYGQLVKLQGKENENVLVCATQQTQQTQNKFEPKSNRMLMLQLTDGHQSLEGMEYQPIPGLSVDTSPGTKIMVCGTVQCRLGVLLLTAQSVQVLGGDVEGLLETNSKLQILANALGVDGSQVSQQEPVQTASNRREPVIQETIDLTINTNSSNDNVNSNAFRNTGTHQVLPSRTNQAAFDDEVGFSDDLGDDLDALMLNEIQQIEEMDRIQQMASSADEETEWPADDDIDEVWLEQVEHNHDIEGPDHQGQNIPTASNSSIRNRQDVKKVQEETTSTHLKATTASYQTTTNRSFPLGSKVHNSDGYVQTGVKLQDKKTEVRIAKPTGVRLNKVVALDEDKTKPGLNNFSADRSQFLPERHSSPGSVSSNSNKLVNNRSQNSNLQPDSFGLKSRINPDQTSCMSKTVSPSSTNVVSESKQWNQQPRPALQKDTSNSRSIYNKNLQTVSGKPVPATGIAARITKEPSGKDTSDPSILSTASSVDTPNTTSCIQSSGADAFEASGSNVFEDASSAKRRRLCSSEGIAIKESSPTVTLSSVMSRIQAQEIFTFNIKGFVVTLLSPLSRKDGYWSILAKISDKTASVDVELSNQVLTLLIGFSVPEMTQMKKSLKSLEATEAKDLEKKLRQGLAQCQKSLIDMHCLMTIKVRLDEERPLVTMVGTTSPEDIATKFREVPKQ